MPRFMKVLLQVLASIIALVVMLGSLLLIAYYHELYTPSEQPESAYLAIADVQLVDGSNLTYKSNSNLIIRNDRIWKIERNGRFPNGAEVSSLSGKIVMPALIDVAIFFEAPAGKEVTLNSGEWFWEITKSLPEHRRALMKGGISVVQDLGSGLDSGINSRTRLENGDLAGPTLLTSGPLLAAPGGCPAKENFPKRFDETVQPIASPEEGKRWVQILAARGVDLISVCYTTRGGEYSIISPQTLEAIIYEAHAFRLQVVVETNSLDEARQAAAIGADGLVGGVTMADELVDGELLNHLREQGAVYIPTLAALEKRQDQGVESLTTALVNTRLVNQAGIPVLAGSGTSGLDLEYGPSLHREMELLVLAGLTEKEAVQAATSKAAAFLGLENQGTLGEGMAANLVVLDRNPLEDISAIREVRVLIKDGVVVENQLDSGED